MPLQWPTCTRLRLNLVSMVEHMWLWLGVVPGGRQQLWAAFSPISSELEELAASVLLLRRQEKKENGGWQDMQILPPPKERERSFPPAECERVLPLSHTGL